MTAGHVYRPSWTVEEFIRACANGPANEERVLLLVGPKAEGKSLGWLYAVAQLAERLREETPAALPIRVGVVRDTWTNLEKTTLETLRDERKRGLRLDLLAGGHEAELPGLAHFWFFGLDHPADADRLQGFECGVFVIEEAAPVAGLETGVPPEAFSMGIAALRQRGVPPRMLLPMNPCDEDHWVLGVRDRLKDAGLARFQVAEWHIPPGEKATWFRHLADQALPGERQAWLDAAVAHEDYRNRTRASFEAQGRGDLASRLIEGRVGATEVGERVVPWFSEPLHVAPDPLPILSGVGIVRGWDIGTTIHPAVVYLQVTPAKNVNVLGSLVGENLGTEDLIRSEVIPFQARYGLRARGPGVPYGRGGGADSEGFRFRDIGDPAGLTREGTRSVAWSASRVVEEMLRTSYEAGPVPWPPRREALMSAFNRKGSGPRMFVQIDPQENQILIRALRGRYHYPVNKASGRIVDTVEAANRVSGVYSNPVQALAYALAVLFPAHEQVRRPRLVPRVGAVSAPKSWLGA